MGNLWESLVASYVKIVIIYLLIVGGESMLVKYESYTREEVHDLISKDTIFQPRTGTGGSTVFIKVPEKEKDYIFFVTFNQSAVDYLFEEKVYQKAVY